eukprot:CAMPEP_0204354472 /NCGR_PEP_ID=MMETSP0469-20131031/33426_1 /ASSEMBLY_ACC=CAM_ASM_000384 /TAXON_ID=2969 /ORGANISM="Oxyrrhis marina" /LENGTH=158 /DNA_ID=CAMNT_0051341565 /DNA_START=47 /DNA_END=523 /DNA_ORIENTATION=+
MMVVPFPEAVPGDLVDSPPTPPLLEKLGPLQTQQGVFMNDEYYILSLNRCKGISTVSAYELDTSETYVLHLSDDKLAAIFSTRGMDDYSEKDRQHWVLGHIGFFINRIQLEDAGEVLAVGEPGEEEGSGSEQDNLACSSPKIFRIQHGVDTKVVRGAS